jgi:hypothetical protein
MVEELSFRQSVVALPQQSLVVLVVAQLLQRKQPQEPRRLLAISKAERVVAVAITRPQQQAVQAVQEAGPAVVVAAVVLPTTV